MLLLIQDHDGNDYIIPFESITSIYKSDEEEYEGIDIYIVSCKDWDITLSYSQYIRLVDILKQQNLVVNCK